MPTRNGPTRWASRPADPRIIGRANKVIPRLAIHSLVSRSSRTTAHKASNAPIIRNTADAEGDGSGERADPEEVEGEPLRRRLGALLHVDAGHERQRGHGHRGDDEERRRDAERADGDGGRRAGPAAKPATSKASSRRVVAEALGFGEDHDRAGSPGRPCRRRRPSPAAEHQRPTAVDAIRARPRSTPSRITTCLACPRSASGRSGPATRSRTGTRARRRRRAPTR